MIGSGVLLVIAVIVTVLICPDTDGVVVNFPDELGTAPEPPTNVVRPRPSVGRKQGIDQQQAIQQALHPKHVVKPVYRMNQEEAIKEHYLEIAERHFAPKPTSERPSLIRAPPKKAPERTEPSPATSEQAETKEEDVFKFDDWLFEPSETDIMMDEGAEDYIPEEEWKDNDDEQPSTQQPPGYIDDSFKHASRDTTELPMQLPTETKTEDVSSKFHEWLFEPSETEIMLDEGAEDIPEEESTDRTTEDIENFFEPASAVLKF